MKKSSRQALARVGAEIKRVCCVLLCASLWFLAAVPVHSAENLRPFRDDAGVFDPTAEPLTINFQLLKDSDLITVRVRNFREQIVRITYLIELRAGDHQFQWDGRDDEGQRLPEGRYLLQFDADYTDETSDTATVEVRIATLAQKETGPVPENLSPETHRHKIDGSLSAFWRYNGDREEKENPRQGESRFRTRFSWQDDSRRVQGVFTALKPFYEGHTSYDGSRAMAEQRWVGGKALAVFREGLGGFDDPMKLFSDFQSERRKYGVRFDHALGSVAGRFLAFDTEGDVDSRESGAAGRITWGSEERWRLGLGMTFRRGRVEADKEEMERNRAAGVDLRIPLGASLALLAEAVNTHDSKERDDHGYTVAAEIDAGRLRISGGYIDLGERFTAPFADPLRHVTSDARGIEVSMDYNPGHTLWGLASPAMTLSAFHLTCHSSDETLREMDASLRFGIGQRDTFFLSWYGREEENEENQTFTGNAVHRWSDAWSSRLQGNHTFADQSRTWRFSLDTTWRREKDSARIALDWVERTLDLSNRSPIREAGLRMDYNRELWGVQFQARHNTNAEDRGTNLYGRVEYRPVFLHRYRMITYAALGNRAAFAFEEQVEIGMEIRF